MKMKLVLIVSLLTVIVPICHFKLKLKSVWIVVVLITFVYGRKGFGPTEQEWGFVTVREGAHMFWWLQQTSAQVESYTERPLVIWLQGGPGGSSTGHGNFAELGPLDVDLNPRNTTWIKDVNVLFVDNPVGTGFSYVDYPLYPFATTNRQIAEDFLVLMQGFYEALPELKHRPLYIFCESYGGKMTAEIALILDEAIKNGKLDANLVGVGFGNSWISPIDTVMTWGPYLLSVGAVDQNGYENIMEAAEATKKAFDNGNYIDAINSLESVESIILNKTYNIDFYNILSKVPSGFTHVTRKLMKSELNDIDDANIDAIMNNQVKKALGINVVWGNQSRWIFNALIQDYMKPVTDIVELLLNTTNIKVAVYNGQLDLIVDTPGTIKWVDELHFDGSNDWKVVKRHPIVVDGFIEGYYKKVGNLAMYWVNRAGHSVPVDNPAAMHYILSDVINT